MKHFLAACVGAACGWALATLVTIALKDATGHGDDLASSHIWGIVFGSVVAGGSWGARWLVEPKPRDSFDMTMSAVPPLALCLLAFGLAPGFFFVLPVVAIWFSWPILFVVVAMIAAATLFDRLA